MIGYYAKIRYAEIFASSTIFPDGISMKTLHLAEELGLADTN